ncbi:periplasmic heavy metal sensor [Azospirillum canadense]|uniref:periplasmic heavy metal sensor n=1 Tax=Azospirillum canadense TaxID=403962 RepID=UPI0022262B20|nr:periplasmic heavy metal sensor [Azospirillum canadense]MCW2235745.1 putative membrane protein [Azospirillum canadense]
MIAVLRRRWMPIALVGSLGLNLFLGGFVLARHHHPGGPPPPPDRFIEHMASTLPDADAAILRRALADHREALAADHRRRDAFPHQLQAAIAAEPFDPKALASLFADHDRAEMQSRETLQQAVIAAVSAMSAEGRHRLANFRPEGRGPR